MASWACVLSHRTAPGPQLQALVQLEVGMWRTRDQNAFLDPKVEIGMNWEYEPTSLGSFIGSLDPLSPQSVPSSHQLFKKKMAPTGSQMTEWERLHADGARAADPVAGSSRAVSAQVARRARRRRVTGPGLAGDTPDLLSNLFQTSEPHQTLSLTSSRLGPWLPSVTR